MNLVGLAARVAKIEKRDAPDDTLPKLIVITPGDPESPAVNFIVGQGKLWARREGEDEEALMVRVQAECVGRFLNLEARTTAPE